MKAVSLSELFQDSKDSLLNAFIFVIISLTMLLLATARSVFLAEQDKLQLIISSQHTSACNGTQNIRTGTLEE